MIKIIIYLIEVILFSNQNYFNIPLLNKCCNLFAMEVIPEVNVNYFFTCMKMYVLIRVDFIALKSLNCFYTKVIHIYVVNYLGFQTLL